mmetsp:Transcript_21903/g.70766  ORF Transcript_21903/g.70766 Transcript_21903/m.70766 type:complete len:213 (-) Transcript_21903:66-704(-)
MAGAGALKPVRGLAKKALWKNDEPGPDTSKKHRINREIRARSIRLVLDEGEHQILPLSQALAVAAEKGLDLVQVSSGSADPVVCRLFDYARLHYATKVKEKTQKRKQKEQQRRESAKELRLGARTGDHDLNTKVDHALKFLDAGHTVRFTVLFRRDDGCSVSGRPQRGTEVLQNVEELLAEAGEPTGPPAMAKGGAAQMFQTFKPFKAPAAG